MKKEKGFTLVEVIVSFSLMSVVMIYLLKTIAVISTEQTNILTLENYSVYESTVLKKIYKDINNAYNNDVKEENNNIVFTSNDFTSQNKTLKINDNGITYDNTVYDLPEGTKCDSNKYSLIKKDNYYILKLNFIGKNTTDERKVMVRK